MQLKFTFLLVAIAATFQLYAQNTVVVTDSDLGADTYNWTSDNVYQLDGYVFLEAGGVLNIEAGTRIEGLATPSNANDLASALIITRSAQINAMGTAEAPIVFTAEGENGNFTLPDDRGSWGGLIILGNAPVGDENGLGTANVEGIPVEDRTIYGAGNSSDEDDDSGTLRYVSIRFGGATLADNNEINGLTLGGVGSGTEIDYIEVFGNSDDGIEFFGGSVNVKHAAVLYCGDDSFDTDQGWSGNGQFWFTIQLPNDQTGNNQNGGEHDGSEDPSTGGPIQTVYNATYIGMGAGADNGEGNTGLRIRNQGAISYNNSIFTEFGTDGLRLQDESQGRYLSDEYQMQNNMWWSFGDGNDFTEFVRLDSAELETGIIAKLAAEGNQAMDPQLVQVSWMASTDGGADGNGTDPRLASDSPARSGAAEQPEDNDFYSEADFLGAFDPEGDYWLDWTYGYQAGFLVGMSTGVNTIALGEEDGLSIAVPSPNPAGDYTNFRIELPRTSSVRLAVFDQTGRLLRESDLGTLPAGEQVHRMDVQNMPTGHYFVILKTDGQAVAQRFVVQR